MTEPQDHEALDAFLEAEAKRETENYYTNLKNWEYHLFRLQQETDKDSVKKQAGEILAILQAANPAPYEYAADLNKYWQDNLKHFIGEFKRILDSQ